jgi:RPA family protein
VNREVGDKSNMPTKIKPSIKESIKDANGKPTNRWRLKHFYLKQATIAEIHEALEKGKKKHRTKLLKELKKRKDKDESHKDISGQLS